MKPEEIQAFKEQDREYLRARRESSSPSPEGSPGSAAVVRNEAVGFGVDITNTNGGENGGKSIMTGNIIVGANKNDDDDDDVVVADEEKAAILYGNKNEEEEEEKENNNDMEKYTPLPESTHTFLLTEKILSIPFLYGLAIACLSVSCLLLVLLNELSKGEKGNWLSVPGGVGPGVRGAQYCGVFVGVLMEEEIAQGLILLRSTSRGSFHHTYPNLSYVRFVLTCFLRIFLGYLFLLNLFVTIVQADDVITIFFDVLALEFVQQLDDVAFGVAQKDMIGKHLYRAASVEYKIMNVEAWRELKHKGEGDDTTATPKPHKGYFRHLLKTIYFINLALLLTGITIIGEKQHNGHYRCNSVNVDFGDKVWENAVVTNGTDQQTKTLVYSYFNGHYEMEGSYDGYPRFVERNKVDGSVFKNVTGAEIKYCKDEEAWVFMHADISKRGDFSDSECGEWLLRSPETNEYNLVDVPKQDWNVWTGIVGQGYDVSITCNECEKEADCNYHGACVDGKCQCYKEDKYFGPHCEFEKPCQDLIDDEGYIYNISRSEEDGSVMSSYMRPIYRWDPTFDLLATIFGITEDNMTEAVASAGNTTNIPSGRQANATDDESHDFYYFSTEDFYATILLMYSGSRWFVVLDLVENGTLTNEVGPEYHAFWDDLFESRTFYISDPATGATPVGVDFYEVMQDQKYDDYGPFGLLKPEANITGQGFFHCYDPEIEMQE